MGQSKESEDLRANRNTARIEFVAALFQQGGKIYPIRAGRRGYVRLQFYTVDQDEQMMITRVLGGEFVEHVGRKHMWEVAQRSEIARILTMLLPYLTGNVGEQALCALQWAHATSSHVRWAKVDELREMRIDQAAQAVRDAM